MEVVRKYRIEDWDNNKEKILLGIEMMKDEEECLYAEMTRSDYKARMKPVYKELVTKLLNKPLREYAKTWNCTDISIGNMWFAEYDHEGAIFNWHTHEGANMSGVLTVLLENSEEATQILGTPIDLEEGDVVLFPSMMPHRCPPIGTTHKIVIGFNWDQFGSDLHDN
jgi:hypothetical protein